MRIWLAAAVLLLLLLAVPAGTVAQSPPAEDQSTDTDGDGWADFQDRCPTVPFSIAPGWATNAENYLDGCPLEQTPPFAASTARSPLRDAAHAFARSWRDSTQRRRALRTGRLDVAFRIPERASGHGRIRAGLYLLAPTNSRHSKGGTINAINGIRWCKPGRRCVVHASVRPDDLRKATGDKGTFHTDFTVNFKLDGSDTSWRMWTTPFTLSVRL